jgi:hypothetical protein
MAKYLADYAKVQTSQLDQVFRKVGSKEYQARVLPYVHRSELFKPTEVRDYSLLKNLKRFEVIEKSPDVGEREALHIRVITERGSDLREEWSRGIVLKNCVRDEEAFICNIQRNQAGFPFSFVKNLHYSFDNYFDFVCAGLDSAFVYVRTQTKKYYVFLLGDRLGCWGDLVQIKTKPDCPYLLLEYRCLGKEESLYIVAELVVCPFEMKNFVCLEPLFYLQFQGNMGLDIEKQKSVWCISLKDSQTKYLYYL